VQPVLPRVCFAPLLRDDTSCVQIDLGSYKSYDNRGLGVLVQLIDTREAGVASDRTYRTYNEMQFTFREYAMTPGKYQWQGPQVENLQCVSVVDQFDDEWGRYRQTSFITIKDDCRDNMIRLGMAADGVATLPDVTQDYEIVVWPIAPPQAVGQLIALDEGMNSV